MNKVTIRQCTDFCCEKKPFTDRWWNAHLNGRPGFYESGRTRRQAYLLVLNSARNMGIL